MRGKLPRRIPGDDEDAFRIRIRSIPLAKSESSSGWGRGWKAGWSKATAATKTARRGFNPGPSSNLKQQRVTVKTSYHRCGGARGAVAHTRYLEGERQERAQTFDRDQEVDGMAMAERWVDQCDQRHFRFVVSPERDVGDMQTFTRDLMARVEHDLGTRLEWFAVVHEDSGVQHAHVMVRGRDQSGEHLHINGRYLAHGIRGHAQEMATQRLGERSREEIDRGIERTRELRELREQGRDLVAQALARGAVNEKQGKELLREMKNAEPERVQRTMERVQQQMQERQQELQRQQQEREWLQQQQEREQRRQERGMDRGMGY